MEGLSSYGPYYRFADLDRDERLDLLTSPKMGTYFFFRHTALRMQERPSGQISKAEAVKQKRSLHQR